MKQNITHYIRAGYPGLYLVSHEEQRVEAELKAVVEGLNEQPPNPSEPPYQLHAWSITTGLINVQTGSRRDCSEPMEALIVLADLPNNSIILLRDFHQFFDDPNPVLIRKLKDELAVAKTKGKTLIILGCRLILPPELEREFTVIEFALPDHEQLNVVLNGICESAKLVSPKGDAKTALIDAARGMTTVEAENAFALSIVETGKLESSTIAREKAQAVRKNGLLEIMDTQESLETIGGLDVLKDWLLKRRHAFSARAIEYGLPTPKGLLITGIPGTGKSLTAKATSSVFDLPLLRLDAGRLFAGLVGQSEENIRSVIQTAEAISPVVLWIDELEKGFAGSRSSGSTDGGTSSRVFGTFIQWMQEKKAAVFVVATANDVSQLPPEMLRKGRWDETFFVDLPNREEREIIWRIQIAKYGRDSKDFDTRQLAKATDGLTGAEIEQVFVDALYRAFDQEDEPTDLTIGEVLVDFVPLSKLMSEQITSLRSWAKGRARMATTIQPSSSGRKIAA
jgi:SpoVK/Ycf46/Vps4 family AAA+-type ATPase